MDTKNATADGAPAPHLSPESPAAFYRAGVDHVPGRVVPRGLTTHRLPQACTRYAALLYYLRYRAAEGGDPGSVVLNMPELQQSLNRSPRWIRRGFHTLAAFGLLYSVPTLSTDGVDRRRYRNRLCLRCDVDVPAADRKRALAAVAASEDDEGDAPFPSDAPWAGRHGGPSAAGGRAPASGASRSGTPAAPVDSRRDAAPARPSETAAPDAPVDDRKKSAAAAAAHAVLAAPIPPDARERLVASGSHYPRPVRGLHPDWETASGLLVEHTMAAIEARFGKVRTVPVGRIDGEVLERAADYREREAARCAIVHQLGAEADIPREELEFGEVEKLVPGFVPPSDPDFKPGRSGWRFVAGCWHAPASVCRCFVEGLVRDFLADLAAPRTAPAR